MTEFHQIKVVLVEKKRIGKWLIEKIDKVNCNVREWCPNVAHTRLIDYILEVDLKDLLFVR